MASGIYQIRNLVNNKIYIGSAKDFYHREATHFYRLKYNKHHSPYLQSSFNKNGRENFSFEILVKCPPEYLLKMEQWFIDKLKPEYNICQIAGRTKGVAYKDNLERCSKIASYRRKLTKEQIQELLKLRSEGKLVRELAQIYGVNKSAISRLLSGKIYRDLKINQTNEV